MTKSQNEEWIKFGVQYLHKNLKINKKSAAREMTWIDLMWGLKLNNYENI